MTVLAAKTHTRVHPRVEAGFMVKLFSQGKAIIAKATDLSMTGLKLVGDFNPASDRLSVCIVMPQGQDVLTEATVRRKSSDGLALEFDELDWDDLFALARFLHPRLPEDA
jgi:hypothetical protein